MRIRVLGPPDAVAVRDIRLEGLRLYPENFGASWEEEAPYPIEWWARRLAGDACTYGVEIDNELAGICVVSLKPRIKHAHVGEIGAMFVRDRFRRRGVANFLMQSAMEWLKGRRALAATLTVNAKNDEARRLYERFGFTVCGQLERELAVDGILYDELLMRAGIS
jgi:ribosomal protein S18 acetylase RimI-like enzyme